MTSKDFISSGHPQTLFSSFLYFTVNIMTWVLMGALGLYIAKDFGLSASQKGFLVALPILSGALIRIPIGILVDHIGPKKTGIVAQLLVILPLVGGWLFTSSFDAVLVVGLFLGTAGGSFAIAMPLASRWYPPQSQGIALGIVGAGNGGTALAALFAPRLAEYFGWRNVFGLALIPVFAVLFLFILLTKESPDQPKPKKISDYFLVFRETDTFWFCFFYGITFGGFVGLASYLGIFFHDQYGLSKVMAGNFTALCVFAGSLFRLAGGYGADRFGGIRILTWIFGLVALFMLGVALLLPLIFTTLFMFLGVTSLGIGSGAIFQIIPQRFQKEIGVITGVVGAVGGLGGFFLPVLLGYSKDAAGSYSVGFVVFACASATALVILRRAQRGWIFSLKKNNA